MTLRARLAVLTSLAVALAVVAASVAAWMLIRSSLLDDVDQRLLERVPEIDRIAASFEKLPAERTGQRRLHLVLENEPIGVQVIESDGTVADRMPPGDVPIELGLDEQELLDGDEAEPQLRTVTADGTPYRVMTAALEGNGALRLVQPLDGIERTMTRIAWLLAAVAGAGVAVAGALGWVTVRAGLRPVDRLADAAEQVAATKDLAHRIEVDGHRRDEVVRLAASVNSMLAALDSARERQRQLVEDAGHELRTPLAALRNDLGLLLRAEQHPERTLAATDRAELLHDLEHEAVALSDMVGEIVELARGGIEPEPPLETDLRAVVDRAVARTRRVNPAVAVVVRGEGSDVVVRPTTLERAIANLVRNAMQASPDGAEVEVELDDADGQATVRVLDRGPGVTGEDVHRMFDRFYRGENARERQGSGLGLAIVAQAAEQHGGTADGGNRPGGGAVFTLSLPTR